MDAGRTDGTRSPDAPGFAAGWDVYEIAGADDPYPAWAELRQSAPVYHAGGNVWLVTRWDLVDRALRDPDLGAGRGVTESFAGAGGLVYDVTRRWLMSLDGAAHDRARGLVRREFTPRRVERLRPFIEHSAREQIAALLTRAPGPVDLVAALAFALPSRVIRELFGIDAGAWAARAEPLFRPPAGQPAPAGGPIGGLARWFGELLRTPGSFAPGGLLAQLGVEDPEHGRLSDDEVIANAVLLVTAAIDTTTGLIANTLACLLQHPDALAAVRADADQVEAAVEETLRFEPPALSCSRHVRVPLELGGVTVPAGSELLLCIGAANRDPARHPDPDRFELQRPERASLTFGGGRQFCLGAALARLEARVAVAALLEAAPRLRLTGEVRWQQDNPTVRAPVELRVEL